MKWERIESWQNSLYYLNLEQLDFGAGEQMITIDLLELELAK